MAHRNRSDLFKSPWICHSEGAKRPKNLIMTRPCAVLGMTKRHFEFPKMTFGHPENRAGPCHYEILRSLCSLRMTDPWTLEEITTISVSHHRGLKLRIKIAKRQ